MSVQARIAEPTLGHTKTHGLRRFQYGRRNGFHGRYQSGDHLPLLSSVVMGSGIKDEPVAASPNVFDFGQSRYENIRDAERLGQILAHGKSPLVGAVNASLDSFATRAKHRYSTADRHGFRGVNGVAA